MDIIRVTETWQRAAVYQLRVESFIIGQHIAWPDEFDEDGITDRFEYLLMMEGDIPVATGRLRFIAPYQLKIERVCVSPFYRKNGVGRLLIQQAELWAREASVNKIVITSQVEALGFYQKLGYLAFPDIKISSPIPVIYTEKTEG